MSDTHTTSEDVSTTNATSVLEIDARDDAQPDVAPADSGVKEALERPDADDTADQDSATSDDSQDGEGDELEDEGDTADQDSVTSDDSQDGEGDELENEGDIAADYLEELLDIADLDGDIDTYSEGGRAHVSVVTTSDVLVGRNGEVLDALQELARLAVMTEAGHRSRLMLDVAGFREKRRQELQILARDAVEESRESGEAVRLAPMNPFERKIVHDVVASAGLHSESEGVEPKRRVVIQPRD